MSALDADQIGQFYNYEGAVKAFAASKLHVGELLTAGLLLPKTPEEALSSDWLTKKAPAALELILKHVSPEELASYKTRVLTVKKFNGIIVEMENRAVHLFCQSITSQFVRSILSPALLAGYVAGNLGGLGVILGTLASDLQNLLKDVSARRTLATKMHLSQFFDDLLWLDFDLAIEDVADLFSDAYRLDSEAWEILKDNALKLTLKGYEWFAIMAISSYLVMMLSREAIARTFAPLTSGRENATARMVLAFLPQKSHGRVRRRKKSRR